MSTKAEKAAKAAEKRAHALALIARTQRARLDAKLTQGQIAKVLRMEQDQYKQYETRTPLPAVYHELFCIACHVKPEWYVHGIGAEHLTEPVRRPRRGRKAAAA